MMLLADIGTSWIKWGSYDGGSLQIHCHAHGGESWTELAGQLWADLPRPDRVVIVSVAGPEIRATLANWIRQAWGVEAEFVASTAAACGVRNSYAEPERMGADRWVAMIAARALLGPQTCYVVDCGTAITIDALATDGQHLGGVIIPGMRLMREALYWKTRQIPPEKGEARVFGQSTRDCVWGGALYAAASAIDGVTGRMIASHGPGARLLTGGVAGMILPQLQGDYRLEPDLIFAGLQVIADANRSGVG